MYWIKFKIKKFIKKLILYFFLILFANSSGLDSEYISIFSVILDSKLISIVWSGYSFYYYVPDDLSDVADFNIDCIIELLLIFKSKN